MDRSVDRQATYSIALAGGLIEAPVLIVRRLPPADKDMGMVGGGVHASACVENIIKKITWICVRFEYVFYFIYIRVCVWVCVYMFVLL